MTLAYFTRVYFSRYFFFSYRSSLSKYTKISGLKHFADKDIFFFSDPYVFNRLRASSKPFELKPISHILTSGPSQARSFFFGFKFFLNAKTYDYSWQLYKNDEEFFKKFFIIFMRSKLKLISFHQYNVFVTTQIIKTFLNKK